MSLIKQFYDEIAVFDDSYLILALFMIFNKETNQDIVTLKSDLEDLIINENTIEMMLRVQENYNSKDFKRIIRQLSDIDGLIMRYKINENILKANKQIAKRARKKKCFTKIKK